MTKEEVIALTYPFPPPQWPYRDLHLRLLTKYDGLAPFIYGLQEGDVSQLPWWDSPPPQIAFGGPNDPDDLRRALRWRDQWRADIQMAVEERAISGARVELAERAIMQHLDAIEKAIPMAEAGWKIYIHDIYIAVLVKHWGLLSEEQERLVR